jgi:glycosyltransferase involved in cell wall biosynthesis
MVKKILFINTTFTRGGAANVARDLFYHFNGNDFKTYFAYGRGGESGEERTFKFGNIFEIFLHVLMVRFLGFEGFGSYFSTRKLIKYIQEEKFDLIHLHNVHGYYLNYYTLFKFLNQSNLPIVWTLHDAWILTSLRAHEGYNSYPTTYNTLFLKLFLKQKRKAILGLNNVTIVSPAEWLGNKLKDSYLKDKNINVISNGVDTDLFKPTSDKSELRKKYNLPADKRIILFSSASLKSKNKGFEFAEQAIHALDKTGFILLGIGGGDFKSKENIKIINYVKDRGEMAELFILSDLFCITSKAETLPLVVLEALSSGLPVVGFDIIALRELVSQDVGMLVPYGDIDMLSQAFVQNIEMQSSKSVNARNLALTKFSQNKFFKDYLNLYKEILK